MISTFSSVLPDDSILKLVTIDSFHNLLNTISANLQLVLIFTLHSALYKVCNLTNQNGKY